MWTVPRAPPLSAITSNRRRYEYPFYYYDFIFNIVLLSYFHKHFMQCIVWNRSTTLPRMSMMMFHLICVNESHLCTMPDVSVVPSSVLCYRRLGLREIPRESPLQSSQNGAFLTLSYWLEIRPGCVVDSFYRSIRFWCQTKQRINLFFHCLFFTIRL